jgi:sarcosine oxidase gamma subunit
VTPSFSYVDDAEQTFTVTITTSGSLQIGSGAFVFRTKAQGFSPSQVTIVGSGATAVELAINNSIASAIQAALNNDNYSFVGNSLNIVNLRITGPAAAVKLTVTVSKDAILTGLTGLPSDLDAFKLE